VVFALALVGAGFIFGSRRVRLREDELQMELDEQGQQLTLIEQELLRHSARDPVTGLHTQQFFQDFLEREWRRASREGQSVTVIMVEVDPFRA
jgi:two-component system chemotaxis family response regulator WspR